MDRVQLDELTITNLRNIGQTKVLPGARFNVVSGKNGMGKTNLVEAVYMLGALRSFRTTVRSELIAHNAEASLIKGVFGEHLAGLTVELILNGKARKVRLDNKQKVPSADHFQTLPMVLFYPQMMELIQGSPEARRRFIDRALFQANPMYPSLYRAYCRAVKSRNQLLRVGVGDERALLPYDLQLADTGSRITAMRSSFIQAMNPYLEEAVAEIGEGRAAMMSYKPSIEGDKTAYLEILKRSFHHDKERRYTTKGPHSDDLEFTISGLCARKFASQGQQRTMVLAAKIAETRALADRTTKTPLLLLDDVSSELDKERNRHLFSFLESMGGQVFITTTAPDFIHLKGERVDFTVNEGQVERSAEP